MSAFENNARRAIAALSARIAAAANPADVRAFAVQRRTLILALEA